MNDTVQTQEKNIVAQSVQADAQNGLMKSLEILMNTMKTIIKSTDKRNMLECLNSNKAIVGEVQQLILRQLE